MANAEQTFCEKAPGMFSWFAMCLKVSELPPTEKWRPSRKVRYGLIMVLRRSGIIFGLLILLLVGLPLVQGYGMPSVAITSGPSLSDAETERDTLRPQASQIAMVRADSEVPTELPPPQPGLVDPPILPDVLTGSSATLGIVVLPPSTLLGSAVPRGPPSIR